MHSKGSNLSGRRVPPSDRTARPRTGVAPGRVGRGGCGVQAGRRVERGGTGTGPRCRPVERKGTIGMERGGAQRRGTRRWRGTREQIHFIRRVKSVTMGSDGPTNRERSVAAVPVPVRSARAPPLQLWFLMTGLLREHTLHLPQTRTPVSNTTQGKVQQRVSKSMKCKTHEKP